jgi:antitoxin VapB
MGLIVSGKTFKSGDSEAVRLPKEMAFGLGADIILEQRGHEVVIRRKRQSVQDMIRRLKELPAPDVIEERDVDEIPEPPGL